MKHFRGIGREGISFGMEIGPGYKEMKAHIEIQKVSGRETKILAVPCQYVAKMMQEAGWLVSEKQSFKCFQLDNEPKIYIIYPDGIHI